MRPGRANSLTDVAGITVGHYGRTDDGWLSGTTVVRALGEGAVGGVDVRGGAPGTRETDLLAPGNLVERVHAVVLSGGSAYGLAAACGVTDALGEQGIGLAVGDSGIVVPIVPAAVIFDLGRGGDSRLRPDASFGRAALAAASGDAVAQGSVGAGLGALAAGVKGGVGSASVKLGDGSTVAALVVVNSSGSTAHPETGALYGAAYAIGAEFGDPVPVADPVALAAAAQRARPRLNTTIGVLATDVTLGKDRCSRLATLGQDGLARAIRPVHTMGDGDTIFALATCERPAPDPYALDDLLAAAADCVTRAVAHAMLAATAVGEYATFSDLVPAGRTGRPDPA